VCPLTVKRLLVTDGQTDTRRQLIPKLVSVARVKHFADGCVARGKIVPI